MNQIAKLAIAGIVIAVLTLVQASGGDAQASDQLSDVDVGWSASYNAVLGVYEYRYTVTNTSNNFVGLNRLTVDEHGTHENLHEETSIICDTVPGPPNCAFTRDYTGLGLGAHNYTWWFDPIAPGASVTVGFSDSDGPDQSRLKLNFTDNSPFTDNFVTNFAPVPHDLSLIPPFGGVPYGALTQPQLGPDYPPNAIKNWYFDGWTADLVGGVYQYRYMLRNGDPRIKDTASLILSGYQTIGPDPGASDNHADYWLYEHPSHVKGHLHGEIPRVLDNPCAADGSSAAAYDVRMHQGEMQNPNIPKHTYMWLDLGDGACGGAGWDPGQIITIGFDDIHGPGRSGWVKRVHGSGEVTVTSSGVPPSALVVELPVPVVGLVGGEVEILANGQAPSETSSSAGGSTLPIAAAIGGLLIALTGGGLFMRRRLAR